MVIRIDLQEPRFTGDDDPVALVDATAGGGLFEADAELSPK
jgi:hypothetical protein